MGVRSLFGDRVSPLIAREIIDIPDNINLQLDFTLFSTTPSPPLDSKPLHHHYHSTHLPAMFLKEIIWNGLYSAHPLKQVLAGEKIYRHFCLNSWLSKNGDEKAVVMYVHSRVSI